MKSHRGISSVVGMVFSIIALTTVVTYVSYSMNTLDQYNQAVLNKNQQTVDLGSEKFQVTGVTVVSGKFNITIANTGNLPINFTKVWIQNKTAMSQGIDWTKSWKPTNSFVAPGGILTNVGQNQPIYFASTSPGYHFKLVTSRGNTQEFDLNSAGTQPLFTRLDVIPKVVAPGNTITLLYTVENNMSNNAYLMNIQPNALSATVTGTGSYTYVSGPTPTNFINLQPGSGITFKYIYTVSGTDTDTITFTASLKNGISNNIAADTVTIKNVEFASQSKTSLLSSSGLGATSSSNILVLHQETGNSPGGNYQMYSGQTDASGTTISLLGGTKSTALFYTANYSANTIVIPSGRWDAVLRYNSVAMPTSLQAHIPDAIYYFGSGNQLKDSSGFGNDLSQTNNPSYSSSCTRDSSGCYTFTGTSSQFLNSPDDPNRNELSNNPAATAGWFKWSGSLPTNGKEGTILDIDGGSGQDFYKISMQSSGKIRFAFSTNNDGKIGNDAVKCTSTASTYGDGNWHFFVAIRDKATSSNACKLYMDNVAAVSGSANPSGGTSNIDVNSGIYIGKNSTGSSGSYFTGSIDYIMHWNNYQLSASDVSALYLKNYGTAAHVISINMTKTDINGNMIAKLNYSKPWSLPFVDTLGVSTTYGKINYTIPNLSNSSDASGKWYFKPNERLRYNVTSNVASSSLDMNFRIDDKALNDFYSGYASFIQLPTPVPPFPAYFTYSIASGTITYTSLNEGPNGIWLNSGTRVTFQPTAGGTSYAGVVTTINGTKVGYVSSSNPIQDSLYVPVNQKATIVFSQPWTVPAVNPGSGSKIVVGTYNMYVTSLGYDDVGNTLFRTNFVGTVNVIP